LDGLANGSYIWRWLSCSFIPSNKREKRHAIACVLDAWLCVTSIRRRRERMSAI
jgi:hypothetical protein